MQDLAPNPNHRGSHHPDAAATSLSNLQRTLRGEDQRILEGLLIAFRRRFSCDPAEVALTTIAYDLILSLIKHRKARERLQRLTARITGAPLHPPFP